MHDSSVLRFIGSLGVASCVVLAMLWLALEVSGFADRTAVPVLETHAVTLLSESERQNLREMLGTDRYGLVAAAIPEPIEAAAPRIARRGFVRLDVEVDASGSVADVRVIDANPSGIYETQAVAEIRRKHYSPDVVDGVAVSSRRLEIVDFTVAPVAESLADRE